ncbi:MAG: gamma-glutamyltransferase [Proteobacteria bacterium]|nr:gamma-glutamyltransferase [Pseudomonadota bacterium]
MNRRLRGLAVGLGALLSGCGTTPAEQPGTIGFVQGFLGGVVADEPRAALVGRDVLSAGGNAVDAAVATYFALAVTLPSTASLGSGGACLAFNRTVNGGVPRALSFLPGTPAAIPSGADRPSAVPGAVRGFYALHARAGRFRWEQLIAPAENLARFGTPVSRALAADLGQVGPALINDPETARVFARADGSLVREGDVVRQIELAATLGRLRSMGPGEFYAGRLASQIVAGTAAAGGSLSVDDLRSYAPEWHDTLTLPFGNHRVHFAPPPMGGASAAQMWGLLTQVRALAGVTPAERAHLIAEAQIRAFADRTRWMGARGVSSEPPASLIAPDVLRAAFANYAPDRHIAAAGLSPAPVERLESPATTGFITADRDGSAVACVMTLNNLFGTGRTAWGTGILLAMEPVAERFRPSSLSPILVINPNVRELYGAAVPSGGLPGMAALVQVGLAALVDETSLETAMARPRIYHPGLPDITYHEPGLSAEAVAALNARGHRPAATAVLGRVNALVCRGGIPSKPETCEARTDPRGFGIAATAD